MGRATGSAAVLLVLACAGCGGESASSSGEEAQSPSLTAATLGEQTVMTTVEYLATPPYADADVANGKRQAQLCKACHTLEEGGRNMVGPNLHGFFGEAAGTVEGFSYSPALNEVDFVWTPRALDGWLAQPSRFLPGNRMTFPGVARAGDRADLIAYLLGATDADD